MQNELRHRGIDLAGQLDESGRHSELPGFPGQVERIDRDAVPSEPWPWIKGHETERLGLCRFDDLPNVDPHCIVDKLEFVDQGDVDRAEDVLKEFGRFGGPTARDRDDRIQRTAVEFDRFLEAFGGVSAYDFGDVGHDAIGISGVFPFRGKGQKEIFTGREARAGLEDFAEFTIGGTRIGGGLQDHQHARIQVRRDGLTGGKDVGDIRFPVFIQRGWDADDHRAAGSKL